jgi:hypothetical protein
MVVATIRSNAFTANRGALFDVNPGASGVGHVLAGYHEGNSRYLLFDPNLGVYAFDTNGFVRAVHMLYTEGYSNCVGARGAIRKSYTIFASDEPSPTAQPPLTATAAASSSARP